MKRILKNGKIFTLNKDNSEVSAVVLDGKKIIYAGSSDGAVAYSDNAEVTDLDGKTVLPGFIDSHTHPAGCASTAWHVKLPWTEDKDELLRFVKEYAEAHDKYEVPFLFFEYYPTSMFGITGPRKEMLDEIVSDRPCLCQDFGDHMCWVNSRMLELMGVDKNTPDPSQIEIFERDEDGEPTGWIKERAWIYFEDKLYNAIGWRPPGLDKKTMENYLDSVKAYGITSLADCLIEKEELLDSIYELDKEGKLEIFYDVAVRFYHYSELPEGIERLKAYRKKYGTEHIRFTSMKLFLDGTNELGNSALLSEHINDPGNFGEITMDTEELADCFYLCSSEKLDLHIHMVGDRAFRTGCDAVEKAQKRIKAEGGQWNCQPIFAHCELVDPADMKRPAELGITINCSCHWSGGYFGEEAKNFISEEKWETMYQFNPMLESGAMVTFSSDVVTNYEFHRSYPLFGMQVAATRVDPEFPVNPVKYPGSVRLPLSAKLSVKDLIKGYTIDGAKQLHIDNLTGSIEAGKLANLVVLDNNPYTVPAEKLSTINVHSVYIEGKERRIKRRIN